MESAAVNRLEKRSRIAPCRRQSAAFRARSVVIGAKPAPFRVILEPRRGAPGSYKRTDFGARCLEKAHSGHGFCARRDRPASRRPAALGIGSRNRDRSAPAFRDLANGLATGSRQLAAVGRKTCAFSDPGRWCEPRRRRVNSLSVIESNPDARLGRSRRGIA
jgi:hypothetical protein